MSISDRTREIGARTYFSLVIENVSKKCEKPLNNTNNKKTFNTPCLQLNSIIGWQIRTENLANFVYQFGGGTVSLFSCVSSLWCYGNSLLKCTYTYRIQRQSAFKNRPALYDDSVATITKHIIDQKLGLSLGHQAVSYLISLFDNKTLSIYLYVTHFISFTWAPQLTQRREKEKQKLQAITLHLQIA